MSDIYSAQRTTWECKRCDDTTCRFSTDGDIRNLKPIGCPICVEHRRYSQWFKIAENGEVRE